MAEKSVVMVTGVNDYWGAKVASRLLQFEELQVIGVDETEPEQVVDNLQFLQADLLDQTLGDLLKEYQVDTVCHLKSTEHTGHRSEAVRLNVGYATNLLEACTDSDVGRVVIRSSTAVYGARRDNPAFLIENSPIRGKRSHQSTQDLATIERHCQVFHGQFPQIDLSILRFANIVGRTAESPFIRFLRQRRPKILLGFDPIFQLIHEYDVVEALAQAVVDRWPGITNVAAEGAMPLSRILRLAGKTPMPMIHPWAFRPKKSSQKWMFGKSKHPPFGWEYLRYSWIADIGKMQDELGFYPNFTAEEAIKEFVGKENSES